MENSSRPKPPPVPTPAPALSPPPPPLALCTICSSCPKSLFPISPSLLPTPNPTLLQCSNSYPVPLLYPHSPNPLSCPYSCCTLAPIAISPPSFILPCHLIASFPVPHALAGGVFLSPCPTTVGHPRHHPFYLLSPPDSTCTLYLTIPPHRTTLSFPLFPQSRDSPEPARLPTYRLLETRRVPLPSHPRRSSIYLSTLLPDLCSFSLTEAFA
ncbi:hypothetical protein CGRA01v4_08901 [Colletotrichum graminicola]|nr:hypothetical protein CGRA01v4_08901 [Colletotrichum graminicola]